MQPEHLFEPSSSPATTDIHKLAQGVQMLSARCHPLVPVVRWVLNRFLNYPAKALQHMRACPSNGGTNCY